MGKSIINGIDVSECEHFKQNRGFDCYKGRNCTETNDCYFKQLKRLQEEKKKLKEKNATLEDKLQLRMASDKESDVFWDEIFSEKDYPFNKENAYKELRDYYFVLEQLPKIYMEITGGTLSKTTYFASSVVEAYNDALDRYYDKTDDLEYDINAYRSALEEIRKAIGEKYGMADIIKIRTILDEVLNDRD